MPRASTVPTRFALALLLPLVAVTAAVADDDWCDQYSNDRRDRHCEVRELTLPAGARLAVDASPNGGIEVGGWDRNEIRVLARVVAEGDSEAEARDLAAKITIETDGTVRADGPRRGSWRDDDWWVSYRIDVPRQTDLDLASTNGGITIDAVEGQIRFKTTNGGARLSRLAGDVQGRTTNGGLKVELDGDTWRGQGMDVRTTNGGVVVKVPEGYSAHFETGTTNGGTKVDFPITVEGKIGQRMSFDLGSGGPTLELTTTNGGVRLERP